MSTERVNLIVAKVSDKEFDDGDIVIDGDEGNYGIVTTVKGDQFVVWLEYGEATSMATIKDDHVMLDIIRKAVIEIHIS